MCEHPREPIYNKTRTYRVASLPNGYWQLQKHCDAKGTKTFDPWLKASHPASLREVHLMLVATDAT